VTTLIYRIVASGGAWLVAHADDVMGPYPTQAAACRAAIGPVSAAIARGNEVSLTITPAMTRRARALNPKFAPVAQRG